MKVKRAQLQALRKEFELLTMKEGEKVDNFLGRTLMVVNKMKSNGETTEQSTVVSKILRSLTAKFNYVVCAIEESNDLSALSIDELHGSLLVHEQRMQGYQEEEHVLKYECPDWEKKANYAEFDEEEELVLMSYEEPHQTRVEERWYFDSGCSNHMIGNKSWFLNLEEEHCRTVKLGNDMQMIVATKGSVRVQVKGITQVLSDVYYIPELKNNLLSIGKLQEKGLAILILDGTCKVFHPRMGLIMKTVMSGNKMFYVSAFDGSR
ncbi:uncharacterized protein LOC109806288 [Cajanus cajan]|uniref:uncharacterized protein LOC109806288 n=1 Tax=Cajanus cajan TaxID=3821 RepID=UPI00098DD028|nr:uncharacterized protein LOC109806288 [Cajanus cajan]